MFYLQKILLPGAILVTLYVTFFAMRALRQFGLTLPTWGKWLTGLGAAVVVAHLSAFLLALALSKLRLRK